MQNQHKMFIGGRWVLGKSGTFDDFNPATREVWGKVANANCDDVQGAIKAAEAAFPAWAGLTHSQRARYLNKAADILERRSKDSAEININEAGSWIGKSMFEVGYTVELLRTAAAAAYTVAGEILPPGPYGKIMMAQRAPLGVVAVISPWNFPLLLSTRGLSFALAVGNTVVLKPSEETPVMGGLFLAEIFEEAELPDGVFNVVTCSRENVREIGNELTSNPAIKAISFTGSTAVGREVARDASYNLKKVAMELGGKDALIILDDAEMEHAVDAATFGTFMHQGQICMSTERIIVHKKIADSFTKKFVERVRGLGIGNPSELGCPIGPIINQKQLDKIHAQVTQAVEAGAELMTGGTYDGLFYRPTVLRNVKQDMAVWREETFGPVAPIMIAKNDDHAIELANDCEYGLSSGIITEDEDRGLRIAHRLETGISHVNDQSVYDEPYVPFGGVKNSGIGRHGGKSSIETFTELRWLTIERGNRHYPPPFLAKGH
jgi:vanillin dehydrogenase